MILTHGSLIMNFVNSLLNTKKSQVISGERFDKIMEYLRDPELKIDPNFKHWITKNASFRFKISLVWC